MTRLVRRSMALVLIGTLATSCVHRTETERVVVIRSPASATLQVTPPPKNIERHERSDELELSYGRRSLVRAPFLVSGAVAVLAGLGLSFVGAFGESFDGTSFVPSFSSDVTVEEDGFPGEVFIIGGFTLAAAGIVLLAVGAGHRDRIEPWTYTLRADAVDYTPVEAAVTVPREADDWVWLNLAPVTTATTTSASNPPRGLWPRSSPGESTATE